MRLNQLFAAAALALGAASLVGGCVENRSTLFIANVIRQDPGDAEGECQLDPTGDQFTSIGTYDPTGGFPYTAQISIGNQLVPRGDNNVLKAETSRIQLKGAVVSVFDDAGEAAANDGNPVAEYTTLFAGTVDPDASTDPGYISLFVDLMTPDIARDDGTYVARIEVFGTTLGGQEIESGPFDFPITVRRSSLIACGVSVDDLSEIGNLDPCGRVGQDGFAVPCVTFPSAPGCLSCP